MSVLEADISNRVVEILDSVSSGMTREEIAMAFGHKDTQAVDQYMRRHGYSWDRLKGTYVPRNTTGVAHGRISSSRALDVMVQFRKPGADAKEIARRLRFANHHEMAKYMQARGYVWDPKECNYVSAGTEDYSDLVEEADDNAESSSIENRGTPTIDWGKFVPVLVRLTKHEDKLMALLNSTAVETSEVPRYTIPGVRTVKSIHMVAGLDQLVKEYSRQKNISQKDIFEVALVQFFRRYGFANEVELLLAN